MGRLINKKACQMATVSLVARLIMHFRKKYLVDK